MKKKIIRLINRKLRNLLAKTQRMEMNMDFSGVGVAPAFFNHFHDLYCLWAANGNYFWIERGVFNCFFIKEQANILELCCGDGFNTKYFYSSKAGKVLALDIEKSAIGHAKNFNQKSNIEYRAYDIKNKLPQENGLYDNIIIDAAIEQLSKEDQIGLLGNIKQSIKENGIFSGLSIQKLPGVSYLEHNKSEFSSSAELKSFLLREFKYAEVISNCHLGKVYLYFAASGQQIKIFENL